MNTLTARGMEELFSSCAVVSVFGCGGKYFLLLLTYRTRCGVVSFFWLRQEIFLGCTDQFFGCGGK
jgi:hypothetical protein